ncbi:MAG: DUF922 domain-containing protein [Notoacmeibacter sp.]|nr:DUF922 domain-containing protein [Notoacmeibacter sp.]
MRNRICRLVFSLLVVMAVPAADALAAPSITTSTEYYTISGKTGADLIGQMDRKGPRHGFLRKAVAQTRYSVKTYGGFVYKAGVCRTDKAGARMNVTLIYPRISNPISGPLKSKWAYFMKDTVRHEKAHVRIATEMVTVIDHKLRRFAMKDRPDCRGAARRLRREVNAVYDEYGQKQKDFDAREHRKGGPVEKSFITLAKD